MNNNLTNFLNKIGHQPSAGAPADGERKIEVLSEEELQALRGGDKEYKPIYDEPQEHHWGRVSLFFDSDK